MRYLLTVDTGSRQTHSSHETFDAAVQAARARWGDHVQVSRWGSEDLWSVYDRDPQDEEARSLAMIAPGFLEEESGPPTAEADVDVDDDTRMVALGLSTVRVSEEVSRAFRAAADERGISYAEAIREALGEWVIRQAQRPR